MLQNTHLPKSMVLEIYSFFYYFIFSVVLSSCTSHRWQFLLMYVYRSLYCSVFTQLRRNKGIEHPQCFFLLPVLVLYWCSLYDIIGYGRIYSYILLCLFLGLLAFTFATQISKFKTIALNTITATLCLYLVIGLFWGALYAPAVRVRPWLL